MYRGRRYIIVWCLCVLVSHCAAVADSSVSAVELLSAGQRIQLAETKPLAKIALPAQVLVAAEGAILHLAFSTIENKQPHGAMICAYLATPAGTDDILIGCIGLYPPSQAGPYQLAADSAIRQLRTITTTAQTQLVLKLQPVEQHQQLGPIRIQIESLRWQHRQHR